MSRIPIVPAKSDFLTDPKAFMARHFPQNDPNHRMQWETIHRLGLDLGNFYLLQQVWQHLSTEEREAVLVSHAPEITRWLSDRNDHGLPKPRPGYVPPKATMSLTPQSSHRLNGDGTPQREPQRRPNE